MELDAKRIAVIFKAFCDENRIKILQLLSDGEKCACKLLEEMQITQPTLSHHMKILCDSGIVEGRKEGKWMYYSISQEGVSSFREMIGSYARCDCESGTVTMQSCCKASE